MDSSAAVFGLLFLLCLWEGHLNSANSTTTTQFSVTNTGLVTTSTMHTLTPGINVTLEASNSTTSNSSITTLFPQTNFTSTTIQVISFSRKCSEFPPLCCDGDDSTCFRGCFCDMFCLELGDCCPDFNATCITGEQNGTSATVTISPGNNSTNTTLFPLSSNSGEQNGTSAKVTISPGNNSTNTTLFPLSSNSVITVISQLKVSLSVPLGTRDDEVTEALHQASVTLEAYLKNKFSGIASLRIRKLIKI